VQARADHPDAARANAQVLDDLGHGATGLTMVCMGTAAARGFGIDVGGMARVLAGVQLHAIALRLEGDEEAAAALAEIVGRLPIDPARLDVSFGLTSPALVQRLLAQGFRGPFLEADGAISMEATQAQELGIVLARATEFLRRLMPVKLASPLRPIRICF
jgi:methylmalonyl-CoA mutase